MDDDPDTWSEGEWIRRLGLHQQRYAIPDASLPDVVDAVNRGVVSIDGDGRLIVRDSELVTLALMEADLQS